MTTCHSCSKSYAMPSDDFGGTVLVCVPDDWHKMQAADALCEHYLREPGADEPEEVGV